VQVFEEHMAIVRTMVALPNEAGTGQEQRRALEGCVRARAVALAQLLAERGLDQAAVADRLGLNPRTLRQWQHDQASASVLRVPHDQAAAPVVALERHDWSAAQVVVAPRGRPPADSGPQQQQAAVNWLDEVGPGIGVPRLRREFPAMARAELTRLLHDYRDDWQATHLHVQHVLHWPRPGSVWAMDFAEPPAPIDGHYPYLLAVRDLASGQQLLWRPVAAATTAVVLAELMPLFLVHGAPLVLKADNGSAFIADPLRRFLLRWHCYLLFSPPRTPSYNGAIEAAIGSLKTRTQRWAAWLGHPDVWTSTGVEVARQEANSTARPRRLHGATPEEVWRSRQPLTAPEREQFRATVACLQEQARRDQELPIDGELSRREQAAVDRRAIPRALVAHDLLLYRRRTIPAPIERPKLTSKA
jgi:transcriptional regulator with XRE-family HTH domain